MLPSREISTRSTTRPAATTALTARVTSRCLNNLLVFITKTTSPLRIGRKAATVDASKQRQTIPVPDFQRKPDSAIGKYDILNAT
jgi:hypothetical protein